MSSPSTLKEFLDTVPPNNRHSLDKYVADRTILARIAYTIPNWPVAANHFPGIHSPDLEAIKHDNLLSLEQQK